MKNLIFRWTTSKSQASTSNSDGGPSHTVETPYGNFLGIAPATWTAVMLAVAALILRLWRINYGLPVLYNVDESFIVPKAVRFGSGDFNPHIFMWPHFFFYLLFFLYGGFFASGRALGVFQSLVQFKYLYFNDPSVFYLIGRVASATAGAASVLLLYFIGKRYHSKEAGLAAAGFLGVCHYHFTYSRLALPEVTMTLLVLVVAYNAFRIYEEGRLKNYLFTAIFGGLAVSTKYNAFLIFISVTLAHFLFVQRQFGWKMIHRHFGRLLLVAGLALLMFFVGTPYALLDYRTFLNDVAYTTLAASHQDLPRSFGAAALEYIRFFFFPEDWLRYLNFIGIFVVAGVLWALMRRRGQDILLLSFPILHFLFFIAKTRGYSVPHYLMPALPFFMLFGAAFCVEVMKWLFGKKNSTVLSAAKVGVALVICLPVSLFIIRYNLRSEAETTNLAREWVEANIPTGSRILYTDYHDLCLKPDLQSAAEYYNWYRVDGVLQEVPKEKVEAIKNYDGPTYHLEHLYNGWNDEARESVQQTDHIPQGVIPMQHEKFSLQFWLDKKFEYAIVFRNAINQYLDAKDGGRFPALREFYTELLDKATVIMEFTPDPPRFTGFHIQILKLDPQAKDENK